MAVSRSPAVSWTLSQTANDVISISRGALEAATTDDVQAIALLACEAFGSTLPMSNETKAKMHQACSHDHQSAFLKFLKSQVGYKRGDSGWQLARSDSGLRFLGLATCLLSADLWLSSTVLRQLLTDTAQDKVLIPTSQQLKTLLLKLKYRLEKTGFVNDILGWNLLLDDKLARQCINPASPSAEVIERLVKCTSSLARVGSAKHQLLRIKIPQDQAAWTISFLKWCLGAPPTVKLQDGSVIVAQSSAQAEVYPLTDARDDDIEISICDELKTVRELFEGLRDGQDHVRGMVSAREYAAAFCQRFGSKDSPYYVNSMQLLPYACHEVYQTLVISKEERRIAQDTESVPSNTLRSITDDLMRQGIEVRSGSLFPDEQTLLDTMRHLDPEGNICNLKKVPEGHTVNSLPPATAVQQLFKKTCPCRSCCATTKTSSRRCDFELWLHKISYHVSTILLLSMIVPVDTTGVLLHYNFASWTATTKFTAAIYQCLTGEQIVHCSVSDVIKALLFLVGHADEQDSDTAAWIASSRLGQTIYPQLLQSLEIQSRGLLTVVCLPGSLSRDEVRYDRVERAAVHLYEGGYYEESHSALRRLTSPIMPRDEYPSTRLVWRVFEREDSLRLSVYASTLADSPERSPLQAVWSAVDSVFVSCSHGPDIACSEPFIYAIDPHRQCFLPDDLAMGIILTYKNEAMRYFSLCAQKSCIIRDQACLSCCVLVARLIKLQAVVC